MASVFGHVFASVTLGKCIPASMVNKKLWALGALCSVLPDADVISFKLGIPYESFWGHRGFTHSILFALIMGLVVTLLFYWKKNPLKIRVGYVAFFTLCTASHPILDALTNGGHGVAFFSPFDTTRYFFPVTPIQVSPIGIKNFLSGWGVRVLLSEMFWIGGTGVLYLVVVRKVSKSRVG